MWPMYLILTGSDVRGIDYCLNNWKYIFLLQYSLLVNACMIMHYMPKCLKVNIVG